jgi:hypothetical protein
MMWLSLAITAALAAAPQETGTLTRPNPEGPTQVQVGIYVRDLITIEEPVHAFTADVYIELTWMDPRLAGGGERKLRRDEAWSPEAVLFNERDASPELAEILRVSDDGRTRYVQRYTGTFTNSFDLRDFPFDRQTLHVDLLFLGIAAEDVAVTIDDGLTGQHDPLTIADWVMGAGHATVGTLQVKPNLSLASYVYEIPAERRVGYYIWKILLPLVLIISMAGTVFWIDPKNAGPQISVSVSSMLTLIAYRFLLGNLAPKLSYLTRMDYFIMGATIMVFGALIVVITTTGLAASDRHALAVRIDRWIRVLYPIALVALTLGAFVL